MATYLQQYFFHVDSLYNDICSIVSARAATILLHPDLLYYYVSYCFSMSCNNVLHSCWYIVLLMYHIISVWVLQWFSSCWYTTMYYNSLNKINITPHIPLLCPHLLHLSSYYAHIMRTWCLFEGEYVVPCIFRMSKPLFIHWILILLFMLDWAHCSLDLLCNLTKIKATCYQLSIRLYFQI